MTLRSFDLIKDPDELNNLNLDFESWPNLTKPLTNWEINALTGDTRGVSPERIKNLKALGYL